MGCELLNSVKITVEMIKRPFPLTADFQVTANREIIINNAVNCCICRINSMYSSKYGSLTAETCPDQSTLKVIELHFSEC